MLYLNDDYCYSLEDLRAFIKRCAIIGPELDNPLIKDLLCALKDGSLKEFLETGSIEEKQIAERLPDYNISKDDVELLNLLHQCFDNSYEMRKISIFDYIELVSVHGKIGDGETKELLSNQLIEVQEGITPTELVAKFKVKKHVNLQLDFYMQHEYAADTCQFTEVQDSLFEKTNNIINLKDTDDCFTVPLHIEIINTHKLGSVLSIIVGKDGYDIENVWKINVCCNSVTIPINDELSIKMIYVKGGSFTMGATSEQGSDAEYNEKPTHKVTLSDYMIGETVVTQELWKTIMGNNPSVNIGEKQCPVEHVNWYDCQDFITKLNKMTGENFRLPTEAEWEYAARGGGKSKGYKYAGSNTMSDVAWHYSDAYNSYIRPVKQKQANELGLYDMSGNVWEWCQDCYGNYSSSAQINPTGSAIVSYRVIRGGSWACGLFSFREVQNCRVSARSSRAPEYKNFDLGLRLVLQSNSSIDNLKEIKNVENKDQEFAYLKIIDFGEKAAQVKYKISHRTNLDIYKANSLSCNDVVQIHQNEAISLKKELETLGASVQIVDKNSLENINSMKKELISECDKNDVLLQELRKKDAQIQEKEAKINRLEIELIQLKASYGKQN